MIYFKEIKYKIYYIILFIIFTWLIVYNYINQFINILIKPLKNEYIILNRTFNLIFTELNEIFIIQTKLTTCVTTHLLIFFILYQLWLFFKGGLYNYEKKYIKNVHIKVCTLNILSIIITYIIIIPLICKYFLNLEITGYKITLQAKIYIYINNIINIFILNNILFQIPLIILNINKLWLIKRKIIYIIIIMITWWIDLFNQILTVIILLTIYELILYTFVYTNIIKI